MSGQDPLVMRAAAEAVVTGESPTAILTRLVEDERDAQQQDGGR